MTPASTPAYGTAVERVYDHLKSMAMRFDFPPEGRINEVVLARQLGVSRTPLREALNRLISEGFLTVSPRNGCFLKPLCVKTIADLYELRAEIARGAWRWAVQRATDAELRAVEPLAVVDGALAGASPEACVQADERFHEAVAGLSGNAEVTQTLRNLNERVRFVSLADIQSRRRRLPAQHRELFDALCQRNGDAAEQLIARYTIVGRDDIIRAVKAARPADDRSLEAGWPCGSSVRRGPP